MAEQENDNLAAEEIANRIASPSFQDTAAVARFRETGVTDELIQDLNNLSDIEIRQKYGDEAYRASLGLYGGSQRLLRSDRDNRSTGTALSDFAVKGAGTIYRDVGSLGILAWAYGSAAFDNEISGSERAAEMMAEHAAIYADTQEQNLSATTRQREYFSAIEGQLDTQDSAVQRDQEIAEGSNEFWANLRHQGRVGLAAGDRVLSDPTLLSNLIAEGIGSLVATAPLAGVSGLAAKGMTAAVTRNALAQRVAQATAVSAAAGTTEVSNVYSETVQDVMGLSTEELMRVSPVMQSLVAEGLTPEEAKVQLAGVAAETAALRQIPSTLALGYITSRFEAMPMGVFRNNGISNGLLQIAGEGIEEAGQGFTGTLSRNASIEDYANIGRNVLDGAGEEAVVGAIAGMGTAGVAAVPATSVGALRVTAEGAVNAANALFAETQYNDPLRQEILGGSRTSRTASNVAAAVSDLVRPVTEQVAPAVANAGVQLSEAVQEYANRPDNEEVASSVQATIDMTESLQTFVNEGQADEVVTGLVTQPDTVTPSANFSDVTGDSRTLMENITGITAKMGSKKFKATDDDVAYAAAQYQRLRSMVSALPRDLQTQAGKILSSKMVQTVEQKAQSLDLNKKPEAADTRTTINVAKTNPTNVNPDIADNILEESGEELTPEDARYVRVASRLGRIVNRNVARAVEIRTNENVNLTKASRAKKPELTVEGVSRQIHAEGRSNPDLRANYRSINDFARDILSAVQSGEQTGAYPPDATVISQTGRVMPVREVIQEMANFAQHMKNKVQALNDSIADGYTTESGLRGGKLKDFDGLVNGKFQNSSLGSNKLKGVRYSPGNANSVAFAQQVEQDQKDLIEAFNVLLEEFPETFEGFTPIEAVDLTPADADSQPTGIDEVSGKETEEQNQQTQEQTETPTAAEETSTPEAVEATSIEEKIAEETARKVEKNLYDTLDTVEKVESQLEFARDLLKKTQERYANNPSDRNERLLISHSSDVRLLEQQLESLSQDPTNDQDYLVNDAGEVMTFYHGTGGPEFDQFADSKEGIFLTTRKGQGREFAIGKENPRLIAVNVRSTNPLVVDATPDSDPQTMWLKQRSRLESQMKEGGHDAIIIQQGDEAIVVVFNGSQIDITNQNIDAPPTGVEDEVNSERVEVEDTASERSEASSETDPQTETNEEINSSEQVRTRLRKTQEFVKQVLPRMAKYVRSVKVTNDDRTGYADFGRQEISLDEDLFDENNELTPLGRAVAIHETAHLVDNHHNPDGVPYSSARTFYEGGNIFNEMNAVRGKLSGYFNKRLEYAFTRDNPEAVASELFAVATEMAFSTENIDGDFGETAALMETVYGDQIGTEATGTPTDLPGEVSETVGSNDTEGSEAGLGETTGDSALRVNPEFDSHFIANEKPAPLNSISDLEGDPEMNQTYVQQVRQLLPEFAAAMNARLQEKVRDGKATKKIIDHIRDGRIAFKRFKAGVLVNPETGQYSDRVMDMAMLVVMDFIATAQPKDPNKLADTLDELGTTINEIEEGSLDAVLNGLPPSQLKDQLAADLLRLLNVRENDQSAVNDLEGIAQGMAAEIITALDKMGIVKISSIDLKRDAKEKEATTILINSERLEELQSQIRQDRTGASTVREKIFNDKREVYRIGEKIRGTASRQSRGNVALSGMERKALKKMQDTPHFVNEARLRLLEVLGDGPLRSILGYVPDADKMTHRVLRKSAVGKNASVEKNIREVVDLIAALAGDVSQAIYYPVGITKVGRHQFQGPNPQSNKLLRFLATPTWSTLSFDSKEDMDAFWLGIAQASGLAKVEKVDQAALLDTIKEDFAEKFGPAVVMMKDLLEGGAFDADAFAAEVGEVGPEVLGAIEAVASMEVIQEAGGTEFRTSLSFELDGLTNGAANMMVNFGHGLLTEEDFNNLQRVGMFLGQTGQTVNQFFKDKTNIDLYETVGVIGDRMMSFGGNRLKPWQKEQRLAAQRLAASIGNFEMVQNPDGTTSYKMTRNTAKNPMTKVNYGSGVLGVAVGVADDMLLNFYEKLQNLPEADSLDTFFYPGFQKDMETMGLTLPANFDSNFVFSNEQVENFQKSVMFTIGRVLTDATRETLGNRIEQLNDMLVLSTNIQNLYLQKIFNKKVEEMAERLAKEGKIGRNKQGKPNKGEIPRAEWKALEDELGQLAPIFRSDDQTLAIGGFDKKLTDLRLSSNYDEKLNQPARMGRPDDVGVRAIPFTVIGSGDAMMMNLIFGSDNAPDDVLGIFDGLDVPVGKVKEYAPFVNEQVLKSWDRDVLSMPVANFEGFLKSIEDPALLAEAEAEVLGSFKKDTVNVSNSQNLLDQLNSRLKENRARKKVFKQLAISVDQMGGSDVGFSRDGETWDIHQINARIQREMEGRDPEATENVIQPVTVSTGKAVLENTRWTDAQKRVVEILKPLMGETRVVFGTLDQLNDWRAENLPTDASILKAKGQYDAKNDVVFLTTQTPETMLHELVHAATYNKVLEHYMGAKNDAVARLESLMAQFLELDGGKKVREAQAAINRRLVKNTPIANANALNEFMAYALSSSQVRQKLEGTQANILADLKDKVIRLLRKLMGGVPSDMFSHVVFNTRILNEPPAGGDGNGGGNDNTGGGDSESSGPFGEFTNYWIQNLKDYMATLAETADPKLMKTSIDLARAGRLIDSLRQAGMLRNNEDKATFKAIYGIVLSDMKLDSNALIAMTKIFGHIEENLSPDLFGEGSEAGNTYSAVLNALRMSDEPSHAVATLFALSQTSAQFRAALDQIPAPEGAIAVDGSLNQFLTKAAAFSMQKITGSMDSNKIPADVLATIAGTIIDHDKEREFRIMNRVTNSLDAADQYVSGKFTQGAQLMRAKNREIQSSTRSDVRKYIFAAATFLTNYLDKPGTDLTNQAAKRVTHMGLPILSIVPIRELVSEMVGTDSQNERIVALLDKVNAAVSGMRQAFREDLPGILERTFNNAPSKEQWSSMFKTLAKTDFTVLVDTNNMNNSMRLLEESGRRTSEMQRLETQLQQKLSGSNFQDALTKGRQLAAYMNGQSVGKLLVRNAYAIIQNLEGDIDSDAVDLLDRWISIQAVHTMDPQTREDVVRMWQEEPQAIMGIVAYLQQLNEAEEAKPKTEQARLNGYKGYIPNEGAKDVRIIVDLDEKEGDLERKGFKKLDVPYTGETDSIFPRSYYVSNVRRQGLYSQGVMQNVAMTYRGVDINTGLTVKGDTAGYISGEGGMVSRIMVSQLDPAVALENEQEALMPVFDAEGDIIGFERSISQEMIERHMGRDENLGVMMGAWAGRQVEEGLADQYNKQLADELYRIWSTREPGTENTFTDLKESTDPIVRDSWRLVPQTTKQYLEGLFAEDGVMVPTSMINLSLGYREASLADMWSGKTRLPKGVQAAVRAVSEKMMGRRAMRWLTSAEEMGQGVVSTAKDIIVIRSLVVPLANAQANVIQLATRGVPTKTIVKSFRSKLAEVEEYNKNVTKIIELNAKKLLLARNDRQRQVIEDKIKVLEDLNKKMSIAPMIEAGAYKNLSEGITDLDVEISSGRIGDYMEKLADKLPEKAGDIMKMGLVSKSTKMYQVANRATQYGDFLAKSIYYDHLISQGLSEEQAIAKMNEEYVNFSALPGRTRSYLESVGLTWFMAFKLRITKIAMQQLRENPVRALAINNFTDVGSPVQDNILTVIAEGRLDYATGFEMLFDAPELNPWVNLMSD